MNQKQYEKTLDKAESMFTELVDDIYDFLKEKSTVSDLEITSTLQVALAEIIEKAHKRRLKQLERKLYEACINDKSHTEKLSQ